MKVRLVISGRSYDLAEDLPDELTLPEGASVDDALQAIADMLPQEKNLPDGCLLAIAGTHLGTLGNHPPRALNDGDEIVLITPVAGG